MSSGAPRWFSDALGRDPTVGCVSVRDCPIHYRAWGAPDAGGIVLLHGGAAHARWWDHVAPLLSGRDCKRVVALDFSGHGDSGWRDTYSLEVWAEETLAVAADAGITGQPVLIGHSMGGLVGLVAAARYSERLGGAIIVDAAVRRPDPESDEGHRGRMFRRPKTYPSVDEAMEHFHLVPPQPSPPGFVVAHVARQSLRRTDDGGWTWKFDPGVFSRRGGPPRDAYGDLLESIRCRLAFIHAERSASVTADAIDYMAERLGRATPFVEIPDAHHHLILDQPLAFVVAVRALLAQWGDCSPVGRSAAQEP